MMKPRDLCALILCSTCCLVILASVATALLYPPGTVTETFRMEIFKLLYLIIGVVSGWLVKASEQPKQ